MALRTILLTGLRILAACLLFAVCFAVGGALSGLDKIAQQTVASQPAPPANQQAPQMPENFLRSFLIFTLCGGGTLSYLILRSRWHGWMLVGAVFVSMYGISTVASQLDSVALLSNKLPQGMIRAIFVQGAIAAALFAPLAVLVLGKWRGASVRAPLSPAPLKFGFDPAAARHPRRGLRLPVHVLRLLRRLEKPRTAAFLRGAGTRNLLGVITAQLDKLPLDLRPCRIPRAHLHRVPVSARSDAPHFPAGVGLGCGAFFGLLDNLVVVAESVDARQCCAEPFLGDAGLQLGLRCPRRLAPVLYCARTASGTDLTAGLAASKL